MTRLAERIAEVGAAAGGQLRRQASSRGPEAVLDERFVLTEPLLGTTTTTTTTTTCVAVEPSRLPATAVWARPGDEQELRPLPVDNRGVPDIMPDRPCRVAVPSWWLRPSVVNGPTNPFRCAAARHWAHPMSSPSTSTGAVQ